MYIEEAYIYIILQITSNIKSEYFPRIKINLRKYFVYRLLCKIHNINF